jgi:hypothetical protein
MRYGWRLVSMTLQFLFLIAALISPYASAFLTYLLPSLSYSLYDIRLACWFFVFFFTLNALFRRRWKTIAIFSAAWVWFFFTPYKFNEPFFWLMSEGFRVHASPVDDYLSRCELVEFVENGAKQTVGSCESTGMTSPIDYIVYYDTTGEIALPFSQRTPEWKQAMSRLARDEVLQHSGWKLFGNFYRLGILLEEYRGG